MRLIATNLLPCLLVATAFGQAPKETAHAPIPDEDAALLARATTAFEFRHEGREDAPLVKHDEPLLKWSNPIRLTAGGGVWIWTHEGRPAVAMCVYTYGETGLDWEIQSLLPTRVTGRRNGEDVWIPEAPGVVFAPIPGAPEPGPNERLRLVQMRGLSRKFSAVLGAEDKPQHNLRRLTQPLHRYGRPEGPALDGAIFGFVMGTDPEVLLLIEAREHEGKHRWEYALARMTGSICSAELDGKRVWEVPNWPWTPDPTLPYITFVGNRSQVPPPREVP